jgi:hypothetical protein
MLRIEASNTVPRGETGVQMLSGTADRVLEPVVEQRTQAAIGQSRVPRRRSWVSAVADRISPRLGIAGATAGGLALSSLIVACGPSGPAGCETNPQDKPQTPNSQVIACDPGTGFPPDSKTFPNFPGKGDHCPRTSNNYAVEQWDPVSPPPKSNPEIYNNDPQFHDYNGQWYMLQINCPAGPDYRGKHRTFFRIWWK